MPSPIAPKDKELSEETRSHSPTPLRGSFTRVSRGTSPSSRTRSLSPHKRGNNQPLHIRMNLTENQMDRLTDAFTTKMSTTPIKTRRSTASPSKSTPRKDTKASGPPVIPPRGQKNGLSLDTSFYGDEPDHSTTFSDLMPCAPNQFLDDPFMSSTLAERRQHEPPSPLKMGSGGGASARKKSLLRRPQFEQVSAIISPLSPHRRMKSDPVVRPLGGDTTAIFADVTPQGNLNPLEVSPNRLAGGRANDSVVTEQYQNLDPAQERLEQGGNVEPPPRDASLRDGDLSTSSRVRRSKSTTEYFHPRNARNSLYDATPPIPEYSQARQQEMQPPAFRYSPDKALPGTPFTPLPFFFKDGGSENVKRGEKKLIGENGWLERTETSGGAKAVSGGKEKKAEGKKSKFFEGLKKIAKDMTDFGGPRSSAESPMSRVSQCTISLNPREQSLLFCELEHHLTSLLNGFLTHQLHLGTLSPTHLLTVSSHWASLGRPRVTSFHYDLSTQLDLLLLHLKDFTWHGRRGGNLTEVQGVLQGMKREARVMGVRTGCWPDRVIAKQLAEARAVMEVVGAGEGEMKILSEIIGFFGMVVEREEKKHSRRD